MDSSPDLNVGSQSCGNGALNENEACDDGNPNNSDGCNSNCALEVGEADCGNGVKENEECCDDGNNVNGDGCSSACASEKNNHPPAVPILASQPENGVTWAPTRLYLSWISSSDLDAGDQVTYDVYFILKGDRESIPAGILPYKTGISSNHFIIQASTDNRAEYFPDQVSAIYLSRDNSYLWKVCARDSSGVQNCSESRIFNTDDSVVGWWRFDENPYGVVCPDILGGPAGDIGETVCDYSGKGNHGRQRGMPVWLPPDPILLGGVLRFDGVDDWVEVENSASLNPSEEITLEAVQLLAELGETNNRPIIHKFASPDASDHTGYGLIYNFDGGATNLYMAIDSIASGRYVVESILNPLGEWNHLFSTYDGAVAKIFRNGIFESENGFMGPINLNNQPLWIGHALGNVSNYFSGHMQEAIVYSKSLNINEIQNNNKSIDGN